MRTKSPVRLAGVLLAAAQALACALPATAPRATTAAPRPKAVRPAQSGLASIYTDRRTASGERFSPHAHTAAHRTLPFGTRVRVTAVETGRSIIVRINDRGPFVARRIIDLTPAAASAIGLTKGMGLTHVSLHPVP